MSVLKPPTRNDSIYPCDLDTTNCDMGDFSGICCDFFNSLKTVSVNATSNNPKSIKIWFHRTHQTSSIGFGCDDLTKSFSNIKIKALGSGEEVRYTKDLSSDSTKRNSYLVEMPPLALNGLIIEFHTADEIGLSNLIIFKSQNTIARLQAVQDNGDVADILATDSGNLKVANVESGLSIAKGDVVGTTSMSKFGQNEDIGNAVYEDIWDGGGTYPYPADSTAPITHIYSTVAETQDIEVQGLDVDGILTVQTITLTGTAVSILSTPLWRVFRMKNMGTVNNAGIIHATDSLKAVSYAQIQVGNNQTLMALYTIPSGKTGYLQQGTNSIVGTVRTYSISGKLFMRQFGGVFQLKRTFGLATDGTSYMVMPFPVPGAIPEKTDIRVSAISSIAGGGLNTTFELVLIDN